MNPADKLLSAIMGEKGLESLKKSIYRKPTQSVADPLELYLPLMVVPRAILSWLVQNIRPLKIGEYKDFSFPGQDGVRIQIEKQASDVYRGKVVQSGKVLHDFDKQSLPSVGGHLMTIFEQYDDLDPQKSDPVVIPRGEAIKEHEDLVAALKSPSKKDDAEQLKEQSKELEQYKASTEPKTQVQPLGDSSEFVRAIMAISGINAKLEESKNIQAAMQLASTQALTSSIGKLVDALVHQKVAADILGKEELASQNVGSQASSGNTNSAVSQTGADIQMPKPNQSEKESTLKDEKDPSRQAPKLPNVKPPKEPQAPKKPISNYWGSLRDKAKQTPAKPVEKKSLDKAAMPAGGAGMAKQPKMPKPGLPPVGPSNQPKAAAAAQASGAAKQSQASAMGKQTRPAAGSTNKPIATKNPVSIKSGPKMAMKGEMPASPKTLRSLIKKSETSYVTEFELYQACEHCGTPEFKKTPNGPIFSPCACFMVLTKDETGKPTNFVALRKTASDGYRLDFNPSADPDAVKTFVLLLKSSLLLKKKFGV